MNYTLITIEWDSFHLFYILQHIILNRRLCSMFMGKYVKYLIDTVFFAFSRSNDCDLWFLKILLFHVSVIKVLILNKKNFNHRTAEFTLLSHINGKRFDFSSKFPLENYRIAHSIMSNKANFSFDSSLVCLLEKITRDWFINMRNAP